MTLDIVVSRYGEDMSWKEGLTLPCRLIVYNKDGTGLNPLPNVGREAHTYLHHMAVFHGRYPDWTIFTQGDPLRHCPDFINIVNGWPDTMMKSAFYADPGLHFFSSEPVRFIESNPQGHDAENNTFEMWEQLFWDLLFYPMAFAPGAIFAISSELLMRRSIAFYLKADELAATRPRGPWEFERIWAYLWTSSAATKL